METIVIEVADPTMDVLRKTAKEAGISIGEVVDRLILDVAPDNPDSALIVALEQYLISVSRLSKEDSTKVFGSMCGIFLGSIPPEEIDEMVSSIKKTRNWEQDPATAEELAALRAVINTTIHSKGDKNAWKVLSAFLHGV